MNLSIRKNTTLGSVMQTYCITVLEEVIGNIGGSFEVKPNGATSAKVAFPGDIGSSYLYIGFDNRGFLVGQYWGELAGGEPDTIYGPIALAQTVGVPIGIIAQKITQALPKQLHKK
jgi:hypothetical protein